jgi:hypothetical protein
MLTRDWFSYWVPSIEHLGDIAGKVSKTTYSWGVRASKRAQPLLITLWHKSLAAVVWLGDHLFAHAVKVRDRSSSVLQRVSGYLSI